MNIFRFLLLALPLCLSLHARAAPAALLADYSHTAWGGLQGSPVDVVKFAQTRDGWLWMATAIGLYRYDGTAFERVDGVYGHGLHSTDVTGLMATGDGALWAGYRLGGVTRFRHGAAVHFAEGDGLAAGMVFHIEEAPDGAVWVASSDGLARWTPGAGRFERMDGTAGLPRGQMFHVLFARDGSTWIGSAAGAFFRKPGERRFARAWPHTALMSMAEGPDGAVWASDSAGRYYRLRTNAPAAGERLAPLLRASGLRFDRDGQMWLLDRHSVERRLAPDAAPDPAQRLALSSGLSGRLAQCFFQDREGNIWIGTSAGIDRLRRNRVQSLVTQREYDHPALLAGPDGGVWVGDYQNDVASYAGVGDRAGKPVLKGHFSASDRAPDGTIWIGGNDGVRRRSPDGRVTAFPAPDAVRGVELQALQQDAEGGLWASYPGGRLFRLAGGAWTWHGGRSDLRPSRVMAMGRDGEGRVWMGHADNHVSVLGGGLGGTTRVLGPEQGLAVGRVLSMLRDGQSMWVAGEHGTMLYRGGRFRALRGQRGEPFRGVAGMVRLPDGDLWLHGADGLFRIAAGSLSSWLSGSAGEVAFERFDAQDGLRGHASQVRPLPSLVRAVDGRLWFATAGTVATLDPGRIHRNSLPPPVLIRSVSSGGRQYDTEGHDAVILPQGASSLRVAFTAIGLSIPERVRVRYRLEGVDAGWQEAVDRRGASYTNLAPGDYRFTLMAANEDGIWNPAPVTLAIRIPPTFVQTGWFMLLLAVGAALLLYAAYVLRVRRLTRRLQERLRARLDERSRIARSLHDTLLQSVQGLLMSFNAHKYDMPEGSQERARLERTLSLAGRLLVEGRDQIMDLRASASPEEMRLALLEFGRELAAYSGHGFELRVSGQPRPLTPQVSDEVYAIGREALFNASRYAGASSVSLELEYGREAFALRIRDDGCGLDGEVADAGARPGHWGLPGMRERAAGVGAGFQLSTRAGAGTEIVVSVPAGLAYQFSLIAPGQLWARLRRLLRVPAMR